MDHDEATKELFAERYFLDELSKEERRAFEEHLLTCEDCARQVADLSELVEHSTHVFATEALERLGVVLISPGHSEFERSLEQALGEKCHSPFVDAIKGISVLLRNASAKTIIGYSVNWKYGTSVRGVSYLDLDALFDEVIAVRGSRSSSIAPGSTRLISLVGNIDGAEPLPPPGWQLENVHEIEALIHNVIVTVSLDGMMFNDGAFIGSDRNRLYEVAIASFDGLQDLHSTIHKISERKSDAELLLWVEQKAACDDILESEHSAGPHDDYVRFERAILAKEFLRIHSEDGMHAALGWSRGRLSRRRPNFQRLSSTAEGYNVVRALQND